MQETTAELPMDYEQGLALVRRVQSDLARDEIDQRKVDVLLGMEKGRVVRLFCRIGDAALVERMQSIVNPHADREKLPITYEHRYWKRFADREGSYFCRDDEERPPPHEVWEQGKVEVRPR